MIYPTSSGFRTLPFVWGGSENKIMVFVHENNDFNPLIAYYCSFIVHLWMFIGFLTHLCCFFFRCVFSTNFYGPVDVCLLGVGNGNIGVGCGIWSELVMKTPQRCQWRCSGVFAVSFRRVSHYLLLFPFLTLGT